VGLGCGGWGTPDEAAYELAPPVEPPPAATATIGDGIVMTSGPGLRDSATAEGRSDADRFAVTCDLVEFVYSSGADGETMDVSFAALPGDLVDAYGTFASVAVFDSRAPQGLAPQAQEVVVLRGDRNVLKSARCAENPGFIRDVPWGTPYFLAVVAHATSETDEALAARSKVGPVPQSAEITGADCGTSGLDQALGYEPGYLSAFPFSDETKAKAWASRFSGATVVSVTDACGG